MKNTNLFIGAIFVILALVPLKLMSNASKVEPTETTVVLNSNNVIVLNDEVNGDTVAAVVEKAKEIDNRSSLSDRFSTKKQPIYLFLNTPGGSIQAGLELIEQLRALKRPVHTITLFAASMGFQIVQAMGDRYILKNGLLMSHRAYGEFQGQFGGQAPSQMDSRYNMWLDRLSEMDEQTVNRTDGKQTLQSYQKAYASEMWRTGTKAVNEGYADEVVKVNCDKSLAGTTSKTVLFLDVIPITYELSNCPMNTSPMNVQTGVLTNKGTKSLSEFLASSGGFGYSCVQASAKNPDQVCAVDLHLTLETLYSAKENFKKFYEAKQRQVIRMQIGK